MDNYFEELTTPFKTGEARRKALGRILGFLDLTTLEGIDNQQRVNALCDKALSFKALNLPSPAAVCVYGLPGKGYQPCRNIIGKCTA